jgi:uncharacterized membrane protein
MSAVDKVKTITLTGNTKLSSITAPSTTTLAEAGAAVAVDISDGASLTGVFVPFKPEVPATETTAVIPAELAKVKQNSLKGLADWFDVHWGRQTATPTFNVDTALSSGTVNYASFNLASAAQGYGQAVAGTGSGTIQAGTIEKAEVDLIESE